MYIESKFIAAWTAAKGSKSSAECIIAKYQARKVEEGRELAELVGLELWATAHFDLTTSTIGRRALQYMNECHSTIK